MSKSNVETPTIFQIYQPGLYFHFFDLVAMETQNGCPQWPTLTHSCPTFYYKCFLLHFIDFVTNFMSYDLKKIQMLRVTSGSTGNHIWDARHEWVQGFKALFSV